MVTDEMVEAGAQALAESYQHPSQKSDFIYKSDTERWRRQARAVLEAVSKFSGQEADEARRARAALPLSADADVVPDKAREAPVKHDRLTLDTDKSVYFYEQEFYVLSNFSSFSVVYQGQVFATSEAAYHFQKFPKHWNLQRLIRKANSAHDAYKIAEESKAFVRPDWNSVKIGIMRAILRVKVDQHEYVRRKLLETGDRELIENSWRDEFWGWGPDRKGANVLGRLWMEVRDDLNRVKL